MSRGTTLLLRGDYAAAIPLLEREAQRDKQDDFRVGAALQLGVTHLLANDFKTARGVFLRLQDEAWKSVSLHCIYLGMVDWFQRRHKKAVDAWLRALGCAYCRDQGMDGALVLLYASVRRPRVFAFEEARELVRVRLRRLYDQGLPYAVARLAINEGDEASARTRGMPNMVLKGAKKRMHSDIAMVEFHAGVRALWADKDEVAFRARMQACVEHANRGFDCDIEDVLARHEIA